MLILFIIIILPYIQALNYSYYVSFGDVKTIFNISDALDATLFHVNNNNVILNSDQQQGCYLINKNIQLNGQTYKYSKKELALNDELLGNDFLIDFAITTEKDFIALTANSQLVIMNQTTQLLQSFSLNIISEIPQLLVDKNIIFIIYQQNAYDISQFNNQSTFQQLKEWKSKEERYYSVIQDHLLFSVAGAEGIDIYIVKPFSFLTTIKQSTLSIDQFDARDISVKRLNDKKYLLYILCQNNGVIIVEMGLIQQIFHFKVLQKRIKLQGNVIALTINYDENLFVAYQHKYQYYVLQFAVQPYNDKWNTLSKYQVDFKIIDIDSNSTTLLVYGNFKQKLIHFNIHKSQFQINIRNVKKIIMFEQQLIGVTTKTIFNYTTQIIPYCVKCYSDYQNEFTQQYKLMFKTKELWKQLEFEVIFNSTQFKLEYTFIVFIILCIFSLFLILLIIYNSLKLNNSVKIQQSLEQIIKSMPQNRASKLLMPHTFRQIQTLPTDQRISTLNYTEETFIENNRKMK